MILEWAAAGAVFLMGLVYCVRMMKRGLTTLEDERSQCLARIQSMEDQIREDRKNMASSEHLHIARAGLKDLLRLAGNPPGFSLTGGAQPGQTLVLHTPMGQWRIALLMRERTLRRTRKVAHGRGRWRLSGFGLDEEYSELADLMCVLNARLRGEANLPSEPPHLARRMIH